MEDEENKQANEKKLNRSKRIGTNTQSLCIELSEKMEKLCEMDSEWEWVRVYTQAKR